MRFVVLLFGFIGILLTAAGGTLFAFLQASLDLLMEWKIEVPAWVYESYSGAEAREVGLFLWIAAGYGFLGTLLAFLRCGKQGGALMLIPVLGAGLMNPVSLLFSGLQFLVALASFFVGPLPLNPPQEDENEDE